MVEKRERKINTVPSTIINYAICVFFALLVLIPVLLAINCGFKTVGQLNADPLGWPDPFMWENYIMKVIVESNFIPYFINSFIIMAFTVVLDVLIAIFAGFALSRFNFRFRNLIFNYFLLGLLFPLTLAILPLYIQLRFFGLLNNFAGVILPQVAFSLPFHIMIFRGFIKQVPKELEDASTIDGYGKFGFLFKIVIPLSRPAIATVGVMALVYSWNNYFLPLIIIDDASKRTLPMGSMDFIGQYLAEWNIILAFFTLSMIPAIAFFIYAQKHIIAGLTAGAIKG
jgi:raffinose/stachyose/melibiose transport system permease protein